MKCDFCGGGVASACVTCDAAMCAGHVKRGRHGECEDCWAERFGCEDCGGSNNTKTPLCTACSLKPAIQSSLCALPPCDICDMYEVETSQYGCCYKLACGSCTRRCIDCKQTFCLDCANNEFDSCEKCIQEREKDMDEEDIFWGLHRFRVQRCRECRYTHAMIAHENWGYFGYDDYWSDNYGEDDDNRHPYMPDEHQFDDDTYSQCSSIA